MGDKPIQVTITPRTIVTVVMVALGMVFVYMLRDLALVIVTAVVLASAIEPIAHRLMRWGWSRMLAVASIYLVFIAVCFALLFYFVPPLVREANTLLTHMPDIIRTYNVPVLDAMLSGAGGQVELVDIGQVLRSSSSGILNAAGTVFNGVVSFMLIIVLSFYFAVQDQGIDDFVRLVTPNRNHEYVLGLWRRAQYKIGRWLQGQLLLSLIACVLVYVGLLMLHVPYAFLLAISAGVLELVPVFGSILAAVPAVLLVFADSGVTAALLVIAMYVAVNQLQSNVIYPLVVQKVVGVSPLVVIIAILVGFQFAGVLGVLIAVPVAAGVQEYVRDVQKRKQREQRLAEVVVPVE